MNIGNSLANGSGSGLTDKATFQPELRALGKLIFFAAQKKLGTSERLGKTNS